MDQSDSFESALSSVVSASVIPNGGESVALRELIGRLGCICNSSGQISPPQSLLLNSSSTHTSCHASPLNSQPQLNLSLVDLRGDNLLPNHPTLVPLSADPRFAEREARPSCFGSGTGNFEGELPQRLASKLIESSVITLSRVSSNESIKAAAKSTMDHVMKDGLLQDNGKEKFGSSTSPTLERPEFGDSREQSSVSEQIPASEEIGVKCQNDGNGRKRKSIPGANAEDTAPSSSPQAHDSKFETDCAESSAKRSKSSGSGNGKLAAAKAKSEASENGKQTDCRMLPEPPKDYIHVRARRGQATDAHSLAERVRREKISQRMKFLQDLVPGCSKVTGKAIVLNEIINYVQSLQRQVEFLSMKLATVNPKMEFDMEALVSKDIFHSQGSLPQNMYPLDTMSTALLPYGFQSPQGPSLKNIIPNGTETTPFSMNSLNAALHQNRSMHLHHIDGFGEAESQTSTFLEDDLHNAVHMGFGQNQVRNFQGAMATNQMKVEL